MAPGLEFEVALPSADPAAALETARRAEAAGFDAVTLPDHLFQPRRFGGGFEGRVDPFTTLGAIAQATARIRLGQAVVCAPFRHPVFVARAVASLDRLSGGRAELGIGAGWYRAEFEAYGLPFEPLRVRIERLEEALEIIDRLWTQETVSFEGRHYRLHEAFSAPRPVQTPRPPIVVGGGAPRLLELSGRRADGANLIPPWLATGEADAARALTTPVEELVRKADAVRDAAARAGRDPAALRFVANLQVVVDPDPQALKGTLAFAAKALGIDAETIRGSPMALIGSPAECAEKLARLREALGLRRAALAFLVPDQLERFAAEVLPAFGR